MLANDFAPECTHARFGRTAAGGRSCASTAALGAYGPGVLAGEHTDEILAALGHDADAIAALRAARVVASERRAWS